MPGAHKRPDSPSPGWLWRFPPYPQQVPPKQSQGRNFFPLLLAPWRLMLSGKLPGEKSVLAYLCFGLWEQGPEKGSGGSAPSRPPGTPSGGAHQADNRGQHPPEGCTHPAENNPTQPAAPAEAAALPQGLSALWWFLQFVSLRSLREGGGWKQPLQNSRLDKGGYKDFFLISRMGAPSEPTDTTIPGRTQLSRVPPLTGTGIHQQDQTEPPLRDLTHGHEDRHPLGRD